VCVGGEEEGFIEMFHQFWKRVTTCCKNLPGGLTVGSDREILGRVG